MIVDVCGAVSSLVCIILSTFGDMVGRIVGALDCCDTASDAFIDVEIYPNDVCISFADVDDEIVVVAVGLADGAVTGEMEGVMDGLLDGMSDGIRVGDRVDI